MHGWFVDPTAQGWAGADQVQVFSGQMGNGGSMVAQGVVAENRPDVATALGNPYWAASGFDVQIPLSSLNMTELFGFTAFALEDGTVYQTYSTTGRSLSVYPEGYGFPSGPGRRVTLG